MDVVGSDFEQIATSEDITKFTQLPVNIPQLRQESPTLDGARQARDQVRFARSV